MRSVRRRSYSCVIRSRAKVYEAHFFLQVTGDCLKNNFHEAESVV